MAKLETLASIKELGKIVEIIGDFYTELQDLKDAGAKLVTPRDEAHIRIKTAGKEDIGKGYGTRTTAGFEYAKGELPIFKLDSRLLNSKLAKQAVEANRQGNYFHTRAIKEYKESFEQAIKDKNEEPSKRRVIILPSRKNFNITPTENWEVLEFALKDQAKKYFELNGNRPISFYLVNNEIVDAQNGTLLTQLWFRSLGLRSEFDGLYRYLDYDLRARGVLGKTSEAGSQKISKLPYTQKQVERIAQLVRDVEEGKKGTLQLEKAVEFLERLKQ